MSGELLVIVEYCRYGNIQNYLIRHRSSFINQVDHRGNLDSTIGAEKFAEASSNQDQYDFSFFFFIFFNTFIIF